MGSQKDELRLWGTILLMGYDALIYSRIAFTPIP